MVLKSVSSGIDFFNHAPFSVHAVLSKIENKTGLKKGCKKTAYFNINDGISVTICLDKHLLVNSIHYPSDLVNGKEYALIGRESFFGKVVDKIE